MFSFSFFGGVFLSGLNEVLLVLSDYGVLACLQETEYRDAYPRSFFEPRALMYSSKKKEEDEDQKQKESRDVYPKKKKK